MEHHGILVKVTVERGHSEVSGTYVALVIQARSLGQMGTFGLDGTVGDYCWWEGLPGHPDELL